MRTPMTIRLFPRDGVVEVCGDEAEVLAVVELMWWVAPKMSVVKNADQATANWAIGAMPSGRA